MSNKKKVINYDQLSALGHKVRWAKRLEIIDKLHAFGGVQPNYRKWSTVHLKILLDAWENPKK